VPSYRLPTPYDKGEITKLEKEVSEIKATTKETAKDVSNLAKSIVKIETLLSEGNKNTNLKLEHIEQTVTDNKNKIDLFEEQVLSHQKDIESNRSRITKLEDVMWKVISFIVLAVLGAVLSLVLK